MWLCARMQESALGKNLRTLRLASDLTQQALATRSGVSIRTLQDIEKGRGTTVATVYALATALGVAPGDLLGHSPTPTEAAS